MYDVFLSTDLIAKHWMCTHSYFWE